MLHYEKVFDHMLHYEKVFGNVFERRESKCCAVLMKHCRKVEGELVIILQMDQQLKTKLTASYLEGIQILNLVPDKRSRMYCSEYFNILEYLFEIHMKSKKKEKY